jgi:putative PIN family toxin of toxin-antitoxin system
MSHSPIRPRIVFDCNLLIQVIVSDDGPAAKCLCLVESRQGELFTSRPTLGELRRVLTYEEILAISPNMTPQRIGAFVQRLRFRATFVRKIRHVMDYPRDRRDEPYIDLAVASKSHYLVTSDTDLLSLMTGHAAICKEFRQKTSPLRVLDPVGFLRAIK